MLGYPSEEHCTRNVLSNLANSVGIGLTGSEFASTCHPDQGSQAFEGWLRFFAAVRDWQKWNEMPQAA